MKSLFGLLIYVISFAVCAEWFQKEFEVMGTISKVELESNDSQLAEKLIDQVVEEMHRIDRLMSPFKPTSELSKINRLGANKSLLISQEMFRLLKTADHYSRITGGAFDISFSSVGYLYDYRKGKKPSESQKNALVNKIDYRNIHLDDKSGTIRLDTAKIKLDLGGIAKGHAVDQCIQILIDAGIKNAFVSAGGDSRVLGKKNDRLWYIGVRHPRDEKKLIVNLPLEEVAISTSGDYERFFIKDGIRYHHIIDPTTGDSSRVSQSVTILASTSTVADALSTSIFILGPEKGLELINNMANTSAIIIGKNGQLLYSNDLMNAN